MANLSETNNLLERLPRRSRRAIIGLIDRKTEGDMQAVLDRLDALDNRLSARIDAGFAAVHARIDALEAKTDARIDKLDARIDKQDARIDKLEAKQDRYFIYLLLAIAAAAVFNNWQFFLSKLAG